MTRKIQFKIEATVDEENCSTQYDGICLVHDCQFRAGDLIAQNVADDMMAHYGEVHAR